MPRGKGLWPAFWLLPVKGSGRRKSTFWKFSATIRRSSYVAWHSNVGDKHTSETKGIDVPDMSEDFHTYSVVWEKDTVMWFFDDVQVASKTTPEDFHQPMYMLINLAVGGGWPGSPDKTTPFPAKYTIDWVRAYARK